VTSGQAEPVLCFVRGEWLYFTTQRLNEQWGDDWNDAPFEHNAGKPYEYRDYNAKEGKAPWTITRVAWLGEFEDPATWERNSPWSVELINQGMVPWLQSDRFSKTPGAVKIWAGMPYSQVVAAILEGGGMVYEPVSKGG
jgi:hypothetical protein